MSEVSSKQPVDFQLPDAITTACACWLEGAFTLKEIGALTGMSEGELSALTSDSDFVDKVNRVRLRPSFGPFVARLKAKRAIAKAVERLQDILADPDSSSGAIMKSAELLYSVSQMKSEDSAREKTKQQAPFRLQINIAGRPPTIITNAEQCEPDEEDQLS